VGDGRCSRSSTLRSSDEDVRVHAFISQTGIKRFNEAVVYRLTRSNEIQFNLVFESPSVEHLRLKFAAVVDLDDLGVSESLRRPFERRDHLAAVE
jgi:hypothetical protein